jgi:hypothetical protein
MPGIKILLAKIFYCEVRGMELRGQSGVDPNHNGLVRRVDPNHNGLVGRHNLSRWSRRAQDQPVRASRGRLDKWKRGLPTGCCPLLPTGCCVVDNLWGWNMNYGCSGRLERCCGRIIPITHHPVVLNMIIKVLPTRPDDPDASSSDTRPTTYFWPKIVTITIILPTNIHY